MLPILRISNEMILSDNGQWQFRFNVQSETSDRLYVIAQHKKKSIGLAVVPDGKETGIASIYLLWGCQDMNNRMK